MSVASLFIYDLAGLDVHKYVLLVQQHIKQHDTTR